MPYENEFELLRETFRKSRVQVNCVDPHTPMVAILDEAIRPLLGHLMPSEQTIVSVIGSIAPQKVYWFRDRLTLCYLVFALQEGKDIAVIGPFTQKIISEEAMLEISERNSIAPKHQRAVNDFFASVPVVEDNSALFLLLDTFCERLWHGEYEIVDVQSSLNMEQSVSVAPEGERELDEIFLHMKNMEKRYKYERQMMDAVALGQENKAIQMFSSFSDNAFEKRLADPLRNLKNYSIIMNTLLRKAAQQGGVHPLYLDRLSSRFAVEIEKLASTQQSRKLMTQMFREYCRLVKNHSLKQYSSVVRQAIVAIEADPSAEMNLHFLAGELRVSNGYLSAQFKKETGQTVTQYIHQKRLSYAQHLLTSTALQIQTVAQHCGMLDVQYFSKLFKRHTGKTPTQYRAEFGGSVQTF